MIKMCRVCGECFNTTLRGRYKYCSEECAKIGNRMNINAKKHVSTIKDISTLEFNEPRQVELEGDGYSDGKLVYDFGRCPKCGWEFEDGDKDWEEPFCCHCGQRLHWFDEHMDEEDEE